MRFSLVTPSFNKAAFLESTLLSVLGQNHPDLDYIVVDGASSDGSVEILERYRERLACLLIEPDLGMYDALAKGFRLSSGEIMGYLGADDLHLPWTLSVVADVFQHFPQVSWMTTQYPLTADKHGRILKARHLPAPTTDDFFRGVNLPGFGWWATGWIQQESTFWRRSLWEQAGGLDSGLKYAGDFDLWCRFMKLAEPLSVATPLAAFRRHGEQITGQHAKPYCDEALACLLGHGGRPDGRYLSRGREVLRRLGALAGGQGASYDFSSNAWRVR